MGGKRANRWVAKESVGGWKRSQREGGKGVNVWVVKESIGM